ncbi:hypothetical protein V6N13_092831 [Hibiscus sabdariffa]
MNMEVRMSTLETNHQAMQEKLDKLERDLKEEIAQSQRNTVGQIALMLGLPTRERERVLKRAFRWRIRRFSLRGPAFITRGSLKLTPGQKYSSTQEPLQMSHTIQERAVNTILSWKYQT